VSGAELHIKGVEHPLHEILDLFLILGFEIRGGYIPELDEVRRIGELAGDRVDLVLTARDTGRWRLWFSNILWSSTFDSYQESSGWRRQHPTRAAGQRLSTAHLAADRRRLLGARPPRRNSITGLPTLADSAKPLSESAETVTPLDGITWVMQPRTRGAK
jgi:hypothetical protein